MKKLYVIWDMDGTLVDSEPEILSTIEKSLTQVGVSLKDAESKLRIGPPVRDVIRNSFSEDILPDEKLDEAVKSFRVIYDTSNYEETKPFDGIDKLIHNAQYIHIVITNKPLLATSRILEAKGWKDCVIDVITPDSLLKERGSRKMSKPEMFKYCRSIHPAAKMVGIGDMALDAKSAIDANITPIGVLWGTGTREELEDAKCHFIVENSIQLNDLLINLSNE